MLKETGVAASPVQPSEDLSAQRDAVNRLLSSGVFAPTSNAGRLLRFVCDRYFEDPSATIGEFDIATRALERRADFNPRHDSVVRVEACRLRKRLREYYEREGAAETWRLRIPPGRYTPEFFQSGDLPNATASEDPADVPARRKRPSVAVWIVAGLAALALVAAAIARFAPAKWTASTTESPGRPASPTGHIPIAAHAGPGVRILAGASTGGYVDEAGNTWGEDRFFTGGVASRVRYNHLMQASDAAFFRHARSGADFSYNIPLAPGVYELRLYFAESSDGPALGDSGEFVRVFQVFANGEKLLPPRHSAHAFDVFEDAGGPDLADIKVFKDIGPAADGQLHLRFVATKYSAFVNAIEITPGRTGVLQPIRFRASERSLAGTDGRLWLPDRFVRGGRLSVFNRPVTNTPDPELFTTERFGHFTYAIPVAPGSYKVTLSFAENYHTIFDNGPGVGVRRFNVLMNGVLALKEFDVFKEAGGALKAIHRVFRNVQSNPQDKIVVTFQPVTDYATVNAIEVVDERAK